MLPNLIVPVLNRYDLLQRMLDSIDFPVRDMLIIDNGGELDTVAFPKPVLNSHVEDVDMIRRADHHGVPVTRVPFVVHHDNSSTINSDPRLMGLNTATHESNRVYYHDKVAREDFGPGGWSLERRRANAWDASTVE
jgi:hypothetical protein